MQVNNTPNIRYIVNPRCLQAIRNATIKFLCALAILLFLFKPFAGFTLVGFAEVITAGVVLSLSGILYVPPRIYSILAVPIVLCAQYLIGVSVSTATILIILYRICKADIISVKTVTGATAFLACEICEALGHHSGGQ